VVASPVSGGANPIVRIDDGLVRGTTAGTVDEFLGIPYAAPPTGNLRWRPPAPPTSWEGVRDATQFGPSCPQPPSPFAPPGPISEDCLYLNVYAPTLRSSDEGGRPVIVWIHGGGLTQDADRNYDGSKLATDGTVVTINYRLGALGFFAHPALASRPGGPAANQTAHGQAGLGSPFTLGNWLKISNIIHDLVGATGFEPVTARL
jgi:para-nitrobenzyl esterase